ncbi:MAG: hypothetical protein AB7D92_02035 [Sphaerochaeta sp.]
MNRQVEAQPQIRGNTGPKWSRFVVLCYLLFLLGTHLHASDPLYLQFLPNTSEMSQIRYQINTEHPEGWTTLDEKDSLIRLEDFDKDGDILHIQQSSDGSSWTESTLFTYNQNENRWQIHDTREPVLALTAEEVNVVKDSSFRASSLDIRGQYLYPIGVCSDSYGTGFGGKIQTNFSFSNPSSFADTLQYYANLSYQRMSSSTSWITAFHEMSTSLGIGIPFPLNAAFTILLECEGGVLIHLVDGDVEGDGVNEQSLFVDPMARVAVTCVLGTADGVQIVVSPGLSSFFEQDSIGLLVGAEAGLRIHW